MLDLRDVLHLRHWKRCFLFPPCFQHLRQDLACLDFKIGDGRAFWGCLFVIYCACASADILVVEQPDTIVADFHDWKYLHTRTSAFRDSPDKYCSSATPS